jgi:hypothetical protein
VIRHIAMFTFREDAPERERADALVAMETFLRAQRYGHPSWLGQDLGLAPGNASVAIVIDFPDPQAFSAFQDCDQHLHTLRLIRPLIMARTAIQSTVGLSDKRCAGPRRFQ